LPTFFKKRRLFIFVQKNQKNFYWVEHQALFGGAPSILEMAYPRAQSLRQVPPVIHAALTDRARALVGDIAA
jgi:hypothetical protein